MREAPEVPRASLAFPLFRVGAPPLPLAAALQLAPALPLAPPPPLVTPPEVAPEPAPASWPDAPSPLPVVAGFVAAPGVLDEHALARSRTLKASVDGRWYMTPHPVLDNGFTFPPPLKRRAHAELSAV